MKKRHLELKSLSENWHELLLRTVFLSLLFLFLGINAVFAQTNTVTVFVRDNGGEPLPGVSVVVKGTSRGISTNIEGKNTIQVNPNETLVFSYLGYKTVEQLVGDQKNIDITMQDDAQMLDEIVIVGFGGQKKANLTGAVSTVKMDDVLGSRPISSTAQALTGAIPGLTVTTTTGEPGGSSTLNVRGTGKIVYDGNTGTWVGSNPTPLILVDNVPISDLSMINPNDIENVTVLKDAAASAIHGARAAFGVVLVTTKKGGKEQKPTISYSNNFSFSSPLELAKKTSTLGSVNGWLAAGKISSPIGGGQDLATWKTLIEDYNSNPGSYPDGYKVVGGVRYDLEDHDAYDEFLDNSGFQQAHNLSVSGGSQRSNYRLSFGYTDEDGVIVSDKDTYNRYNTSLMAGSDVTDWLNVQGEVMYSQSNKSMPYSSTSYWGKASGLLPSSPIGYSDYIGGQLLPVLTPANIVKLVDTENTRTDDLRLVGRMTLSPFKGFKAVAEFTYTTDRENKTSYDKKVTMADADKWALAYTTNSDKFAKTNSFTDHTALNIYGSYNKAFGSHDLTFMAGFNQEYDYYEYLTAANTDMINAELPSIKQGTGTITSNDLYQEYAVRGAFYRVNYDYQGKYLLEANGRYDGSSRFPKDTRFGFFPSFSGGWRISEESFLESSRNWLSNLKLRAGWGNIGNQNVDKYSYIAEMTSGYAYWANGDGTRYRSLSVPGLVSSTLTWETVQTLDVGVDVGLFNNRLSAVFDWYDRKTLDMLAPGMDLPSVVGASAPNQNSADLKTLGWEIELKWRDKIGNVNYHIGFNMFDSQTEVTKFDDNDAKLLFHTNGNNNMYVGKKIGEIWGLVTDRYYTADDFDVNGKLKPGVPGIKNQTWHYPGDVLYKSLDGDDVITTDKQNGQTFDKPGDYKVIGNTTPRYNYGIMGGVEWNNFDFSFFLQGVGKRDLWVSNAITRPFDLYEFQALYEESADFWTPDNLNAKYPRFYDNSRNYTSYNYQTQSKYLQDASFLRIKNITFGYSIPQNILKKINISRLRVFASGENLYTFKHTPRGWEPDLTAKNNVSTMQYPFMRMFSFGINLSF